MSAADLNVSGVEITESILITSSRESVKSVGLDPSRSDANADSNVPTIVELNEDDDVLTDGKSKELLTLEVVNLGGNTNGNIETKEADSAQCKAVLEKLPAFETVQISNADSSIEATSKEVYLHNSRLKNAHVPLEEEAFEVVKVIGLPNASKSLSSSSEVNPLADVNNDDLIAILEGDADSTTAKAESAQHATGETIVFEVVEEEEKKVLDAEEVKKIALEQIRSIPTKKRSRAANKQDGGALVSSLVSDWSDNEKDVDSSPPSTQSRRSPIKSSPTKVSDQKVVVIRKKVNATKGPAAKTLPVATTSMKPARIIKKKIIWDPDAPETTFSYASLIKPSTTPRSRKSSSASSTQSVKTRQTEDCPTPAEKPKPEVKAKAKQAENNKGVAVAKTKPAAVAVPNAKQVQQPTIKSKSISVSASRAIKPQMRILNKMKRATPSPLTAIQTKRKRVTEIDKLLSDEGAANMLSTLDTDSPTPKDSRGRKTPTTVSLPTETTAKRSVTPKKRPGRPSAASGWDYVYNQRTTDSLIIRRRSNSSYSSTSPRRLSIDAKPGRAPKSKTKAFEFAKPLMKTAKRGSDIESVTIIEDIKKSSNVQETTSRKSTRALVPVEQKLPVAKSGNLSTESHSSNDENNTASITVKRHGNVVQIVLKPKLDKIRNSFTVQLMNEVIRQLDTLQNDNTCKVVMITSAGPSFCQGVDFFALTQGNADKRKSAVNELADSVTDFLKSLITFPKPLIAGIVGSCSGIGVTMLPAFDAVISSDKSTFEAVYAKIGQIPEGHCLLASTNNVRHSFKVKLLWLCEKLTSTEAALSGLVTKLTAPSKVVEDTIQCGKRIASLSQQSLVAIKGQRPDIKKLLQALNDEQKLLKTQWQTTECLEKFKKFVAHETW